MPSNPHASDIPEEARTLAQPDALAELRDDPVLASVRTFESFPILGSCVLFARLGGGAQGAVYRAWHRELNIQVAVKVRVAGSGIAADRFVLEAGQGAGLTHQNLIGALEVKEADGLQYMILDYVDGEDVAARMRRKRRMEPQEALTILRDAAIGLAFAHKKGVLHRDIKPANIMISKDGEVKIADLGLAKAAGVTDVSLTMAGSGMGTPMFMPPEQFVEAKSVGPAADVYSLAITGWLMLAGRNPFKGSSPYEIKDHVCDTGVANLQNIVPGIAPSIADLLARGTERKASKRIPDGAHFLTELERELYTLGGPVDLTDPQAGASLHMGVQPPTSDVITRLAEHENLVRDGARNEHVTVPSGPRNDSPVVPARDVPAQEKKKSPAAAAAVLLLLAGGGGAGWWFTMGPGSVSTPAKAKPGSDPKAKSPADRTPVNPKGGTDQDPETGPNKTIVEPSPKATTEPKTPPSIDHAALADSAFGEADWSTMFQEMQRHVETSTLGASELKDWVAERTGGFRELATWKQTRDRLNEAGREAVAALAGNAKSSTPLVWLTAAELDVVYDGLRYRVVDEPGNYEAFLKRCLIGPRPVKADAKFLLGVAQLHVFLKQSKGNQIPAKEVTDKAFHRLKGAHDDGHDSAGAWLGLLYLRIGDIERASKTRESVPRSWVIEKSDVVEIVKQGTSKGSKEAHYVLATMYDLGIAAVDAPEGEEPVERRKLSNKHHGSAARLGHPVAMTILLERNVDMGSAVNDNLEMLESFKDQPNPETRFLVERLLALAILTKQPGEKLKEYPIGPAAGTMYSRAQASIGPEAPDQAWLDRALWLLLAPPVIGNSTENLEQWCGEASATLFGGTYRPLVMHLLMQRDESFHERTREIYNAGQVFTTKIGEVEVLVQQLQGFVKELKERGRFLPLVEMLLAKR